jgi:hypothetical protein
MFKFDTTNPIYHVQFKVYHLKLVLSVECHGYLCLKCVVYDLWRVPWKTAIPKSTLRYYLVQTS